MLETGTYLKLLGNIKFHTESDLVGILQQISVPLLGVKVEVMVVSGIYPQIRKRTDLESECQHRRHICIVLGLVKILGEGWLACSQSIESVIVLCLAFNFQVGPELVP